MSLRGKLIFWLDAANALLFAALMITGGLMAWVLPPGSGRHGHWRTITTWLGFSRHDLGNLHFWVAVALTIGVLTHLALHGGWIKAMLKRHLGAGATSATPQALPKET
jgi:hypothetical protein